MANRTTIIENLIKHLEMSRQLYYEAKQILKRKLNSDDTRKAIRDVAKEKKLNKWKLISEVRVLKEKQKYIATKKAIHEAYTNNADKNMMEEIATRYDVSKELLHNEAKKRKKMKSYNYDPVIQSIEKVFTFSQERTLMEMLHEMLRTKNECKCQLCALIYLSEMAYKFAKENARCPEKWKKTADLQWLYTYEIRHMKSFRKYFDSFKECKIFPYLAYSFAEQQTSPRLSTSSDSTQEDQSPSFNVPPILEKKSQASTSGLQHPYGPLQSSTPRAPQQEGSESHQDPNVPPILEKKSQASTSGLQHPYGPLQSSTPRAPQQEGSESHQDPNVSRKRKRMESQSSSSRQSSYDASSQASTPRAPQQEGFESYQKDFNVHIMEYIKKHINLSERLTEAANQVLYNNKNIIDIALENDLDLWILQRNVEISKRTNVYLARKFKDAIDEFKSYVNIQDSDKKNVSCIARKNDIGEEFEKHLENEVRRSNQHLKSKKFKYIYNEKNIIKYEVFTSEEEREILKQLYQSDADCYCQLCAMEYLIDLAYIFAKQKNISYPSVWDKYQKVNALWLLEFHMRNRVQMVLYQPTSLCKSSPASTGGSSSLDEQTESTTRPRYQRKCRKPSKDSKVLKPKERLKIIKGWIKRHVEISDQLDKAAKQVLKKNKDIERVAHEYKLDLWILNKKVRIIKFRKTQFDTRRKHDAVNAVKCNILSVSDAAKEYRVDKDLIHDSLKKSKNSDSSALMTYEELKTDDTVLTLNEEFLLLNNLQRQVSNSPDCECECRSCALQKLPSLAYEFAQKNKRPYPSAWNTTKEADVIWICEFEMRHSMEITNYFQNECKAEILSLVYN